MSPKDRQAQMRAATADVIAWQDHGDHAARARAIASVEDMVRLHVSTARRRFGHLGVTREDLTSAGHLGATIATDRFDRSRGADYAAVASYAIREYVERTARLSSGVVTPPDSKQARSAEAAIYRALAAGHSIEDAANQADLGVDEAQAIVGRTQTAAFDQEEHADIANLDPTDGIQAETLARLLDEALGELTEQEASVVRAHHIEGRPFISIGPEHGYTAQWAGQVHRRAMARLRGVMRARGLRAEDLF